MSMNEPLAGEPTQPRPASYHPGHPWYYLPRGDNQPPLPVADRSGQVCRVRFSRAP